jgi:hypothetical protein
VTRYRRAKTNDERRRRTIAAIPWGVGAALVVLGFVLAARIVTGHDPPPWTAWPVVGFVVAVGLLVE